MVGFPGGFRFLRWGAYFGAVGTAISAAGGIVARPGVDLEGNDPMKKRKLGNSGLEIAPLALGGNVFGWTADELTSFRLLDAFVAAGCNLIDTADVYSAWVPGNKGGESETVLGKWLKRRGNRRKVLIATKVGKEMGPEMERAPWKPRRPFPKMLSARETSTRALRPEPQALRERPEPQGLWGRLEPCYPQAWPAAEATQASSPSRRRGRSLRPGSERASSTNISAFVPTPFPRLYPYSRVMDR